MAHFFHAIFSPMGQNLKTTVHDCSKVIAEIDTEPLVQHLHQTFWRKTEIEDAALGPLSAIRNVRFSLVLYGNSTAGAKFYLDEAKDENTVVGTLLFSGRKKDVDQELIVGFDQLIRQTFAGSRFETSSDLKNLQHRPLCASFIMPTPATVDRIDGARIVLAAQLPFAAAFFRWKGIA